MIFSVFQKNWVLGYFWSTLMWYRCYYPHWSRDALSPVRVIFFTRIWPYGLMHSISRFVCRSVCLSVRLSVRVFTFELPFKRLFAPTSWNQMSNIFRDSKSLGKSNGKTWSQIWTFLVWKWSKKAKQFFFFWLILPLKHSGNQASQWIRDLWLKGVLLILAYF